jgi:DNA-binding IclR family transcriptional regulator
MKAATGRVEEVHPVLVGERLKARLRVATAAGQMLEAWLPDRELAALVPRSVLVGPARNAPPELLSTIEPMLTRLALGRQVRVWSYRERSYASFLTWRAVRFGAEQEAEGVAGETEPAPAG